MVARDVDGDANGDDGFDVGVAVADDGDEYDDDCDGSDSAVDAPSCVLFYKDYDGDGLTPFPGTEGWKPQTGMNRWKAVVGSAAWRDYR